MQGWAVNPLPRPDRVVVSARHGLSRRAACPDRLAPVTLEPLRAGAAHVVQLGPVRVEQRGPQPAPPPHTTSRPRPCGGVASNTLETYESENALISNLPSCAFVGRRLAGSPDRRFLSLRLGCSPTKADHSILRRLIRVTYWFEPLILRLRPADHCRLRKCATGTRPRPASISHEHVRRSLPLHPILGAPGHDCADQRKIGPLMAMEIKRFSDG